MKKIRFLISAMLCIGVGSSFAQTLPEIQSSFKEYTSNTLQEKLYLHTDKNGYTAGELIWFRIYNVDGMLMKPLKLSKVAYVELLDEKQTPVLQTKIALSAGAGSGSLYLPANLSTGNFLLRAYTSWMKNFGPEYYFSKKLTIINPLKSPDAVPKPAPANYDIQFFPEGGNLLAGVESTIAVKATDQWGKGANFKGAIINQKNDTILRFQSLKFGMGRFNFKPQNNVVCRAVINIDGKIIQKDLPPVSAAGYVMGVKDEGDQLRVTVSTNLPGQPVYLFVQTRGVIDIVQMANTGNGQAVFTFGKQKLGEGISQITVFNSAKQPVCERLFFKMPAKTLAIEALADAQQYAPRKKVAVTLSTWDKSRNTIDADLSLSVYRLDSLQHDENEDILSYLWLRSDLKGTIEAPSYYFNNITAESSLALDNLMLTQGWRRFNWSNILEGKTAAFEFLPEFNGPIVTGRVINKLNNQPEKDIVAYLGIPGKQVQLYTAKSDPRGKLFFNMKPFYGQHEIVGQNNTNIDTNYRIDILTPFSEEFAAAVLPHPEITTAMKATFEEQTIAMQVQNIYNGDKMK
ncbi:MAG TPA: hypothetical protein VIM77_06780, partial [Mucilaginibacter sp.]